jgi:hypothetical protein
VFTFLSAYKKHPWFSFSILRQWWDLLHFNACCIISVLCSTKCHDQVKVNNPCLDIQYEFVVRTFVCFCLHNVVSFHRKIDSYSVHQMVSIVMLSLAWRFKSCGMLCCVIVLIVWKDHSAIIFIVKLDPEDEGTVWSFETLGTVYSMTQNNSQEDHWEPQIWHWGWWEKAIYLFFYLNVVYCLLHYFFTIVILQAFNLIDIISLLLLPFVSLSV